MGALCQSPPPENCPRQFHLMEVLQAWTVSITVEVRWLSMSFCSLSDEYKQTLLIKGRSSPPKKRNYMKKFHKMVTPPYMFLNKRYEIQSTLPPRLRKNFIKFCFFYLMDVANVGNIYRVSQKNVR